MVRRGTGFRVEGSGFTFQDLGCEIYDSKFKAQCLRLKVKGLPVETADLFRDRFDPVVVLSWGIALEGDPVLISAP